MLQFRLFRLLMKDKVFSEMFLRYKKEFVTLGCYVVYLPFYKDENLHSRWSMQVSKFSSCVEYEIKVKYLQACSNINKILVYVLHNLICWDWWSKTVFTDHSTATTRVNNSQEAHKKAATKQWKLFQKTVTVGKFCWFKSSSTRACPWGRFVCYI